MSPGTIPGKMAHPRNTLMANPNIHIQDSCARLIKGLLLLFMLLHSAVSAEEMELFKSASDDTEQ